MKILVHFIYLHAHTHKFSNSVVEFNLNLERSEFFFHSNESALVVVESHDAHFIGEQKMSSTES